MDIHLPPNSWFYLKVTFQNVSSEAQVKNFFYFVEKLCSLSRYLNLVLGIFIKFLFFHQMIGLQKLWKIFFISSKKLF